MRRSAVGAVFVLVLSMAATVGASSPAVASPSATSAGAVSPAPADALSPAAALSGTSKFAPLPPTRVLDTRIGLGAPGMVPPGGTVTLVMPGRGGVPATGVSAVLLNVTLAEGQAPGFVQVYPTGQAAVGASSNLNIERVGQTVPNLVVAPLGDAGQVSIYTQGGGHLIADVFGYFTTASVSVDGRYVPVFPSRLLDTRMQAPGKLGAGGSARVQIVGRNGVPATGASAVVLNVTATDATEAGYVQVLPTGQAAFGTFSNLNVTAGQTIPNLVVVPVGADGSVTVYSERGTHIIVDMFGYFTNQTADVSSDGLFVPISPSRLLDSRSTAPATAGSITPIAPLGRVGIPPTGVAAIFGNLTATESTSGGYLQVVPGPAATAPVGFWSNVNLERAGQTIPNSAIANLGTDNTFLVYTSTATQLLFDASGYFTGTASIVNHPPTVVPIQVAVTAGQSIDINVLDYASEPDGDQMSVTGFSQPGDGVVSQIGAGAIRYSSFVGGDRNVSFTVTVADNRGAATTATVTVHVTAGVVPVPCSTDFGNNGAYPAESAQLSGAGSAGKRCVNSGFHGTGYIGDWNGNQAITFTVNAPTGGQYNLGFRYQNAAGTSSRQLGVPTGTTTIVFPNTHGGDTSGNWANGAWSEATVNVALNPGANAITLYGGSGFVDLDEITNLTPTPTGLPTAPTAVIATALAWSNPEYGQNSDLLTAQGQFQVQWNDNANNETGYRIYEVCCHYGTNTRTLLATVGANTTSAILTETGFTDHHTIYSFEIAAFNSAGESTAAESWIFAPEPNIPQVNSYNQLSPTTVQLSWTQAPALGFRASYFRIQSSSNLGEGLNAGPANYAVSYTANGVGVFTAVLTLTPSSYQCITLAAWYNEDTEYGRFGSASPPTCVSAPGTDPSTRTFEAEYASLTGSPAPTVSSANPGYTGSGYVGAFGSVGQRVTFNVHNVGTYSSYTLYLRERSIETGVTRRIYVNGVDYGVVALPQTSSTWTANAWALAGPASINLHQGDNTIVIEYVGTGGNKYIDLDSVQVNQA
jgi:hypothetical protein